ncbi:MAG TPA: glycine zipper 2TM domain-containing protein [Gammaproteobacteria bacterium]|nr:glycine zipper 2TM domain-containing protein [Gammaproteobacteria bacterium]
MQGIRTIFGCALIGALLALAGCASNQPVQPVQPYGTEAAPPPAYNQGNACYDCGTVTDIQPIPQGSSGNVAGAVIGALVGAAVGHQFGGGRGQTAATVAGAAGGAYAGSKIQGRYANGNEYDYRITLRMDSGATCSVVQDQPPNFGVGARIRLNSGISC